MPINSKNKGATFERKIAQELSTSLGYSFNRTPCSGGLQWAEKARVCGDIVPQIELIETFPFCIECKKVETTWDFSTILKKNEGLVYKYWLQAKQEGVASKKAPALVFSKNRRETYVIIDIADLHLLRTSLAKMPVYMFCEGGRLVLPFRTFIEGLQRALRGEKV